MSPSHAIQVTEQDFQVAVVERSRDVPVLVDFWAPWCGPCQALGPMLERLAQEYAGAFVLAKVNTDESPQLASVFQIQSIPAVHLVADGRVVDSFVGALPEAQIREFLRPHLKAPADAEADAVEEKLAAGDVVGAEAELESRLAEDPTDAEAHLQLARLAFGRGDEEAVRLHVDAIPEDADEAKAALPLREALVFRSACGAGESAWRQALEEDPEDLDARYGLGCCLAATARYEEALAAFLDVVKRDRRHGEGAAHRGMLTIFGLLEPGSDLARDYRRQLTIYL